MNHINYCVIFLGNDYIVWNPQVKSRQNFNDWVKTLKVFKNNCNNPDSGKTVKMSTSSQKIPLVKRGPMEN